MAHYAYLDENNVVIDVIVGKDEDEAPGNWEEYYKAKRTSYNTRGGVHYNSDNNTPSGKPQFRKNYAGVGFTYDPARDAFIPPRPYQSWLLNEDSCLWEPPVPHPGDGKQYLWDEASVSWAEMI